MEHLETAADRFPDKLQHTTLPSIRPAQLAEMRRWADQLESATDGLLHAYKQQDTPKFQFKLEEALMLAAGLDRALLSASSAALLEIGWTHLRGRLDMLAGALGYPPAPEKPRS
jgi:hypothetical protein